ncbi:branched chain amino acid aminotransferase [Patiriisocius marinistellae]|uniref:Branched chain amino acid aminotransferase n=2 Tax=Patiriisocius marinistellae TaxID=2494560 RepID=A0A5J4FT47_9FLAO|nr:branched chain amino acid aminotransferase [Patiriisocius marinistellae]
MYSFAQRKNIKVLDEPFYAYYLHNKDKRVKHPSENEIFKSMEISEEKIIAQIEKQALKKDVFIKGMAHHYLSNKPQFILNWENIILIRHPQKLLTSFSKVIENPTIDDIGIKKASQLFTFLSQSGNVPLIIDSDELIKSPKVYLQKICEKLKIPFSEKMLKWKKGGIPEDGVWAKHWYKNVHNSQEFSVQKSTKQKIPERLLPVLDEALDYYNILKNYILKND